jgi:hypothetical protein
MFRRKTSDDGGARPGTPPATRRVELDLPSLERDAAELAALLLAGEVSLALIRARLADRCRDAGVRPPPPQEIGAMLEALDPEGRRRVALAVALLERLDKPKSAALLAAMAPGEAGPRFLMIAPAAPALTLDLVRTSPLRAQEFCRQFAAQLGAAIRGESDAESRQRLARLDYAKLLAEAERAKASAEERLAYVKKLREQNAPRRGKW